MSIKRKIAVTTLAASLVTGSLAALPYSDKGLAEQFGLVNVASADASPYDAFLNRLDNIYPYLTDGDVITINSLRTQISTLDNISKIDPLMALLPGDLQGDEEFQQGLFNTFKTLGLIMYSTSADQVNGYHSNPALDVALDYLAGQTEVSRLTADDLALFINAVETALLDNISDIENINDLFDDESGSLVTGLVKASLSDVLSNDDLKVSQVLNWIKDNTDISSNELAEAVAETFAGFSTDLTSGGAATQALMVAFVNAEATDSHVTSSNGRTKTYSLKVDNIKLPSYLVEWSEVSSSSNVTVSEDGQVELTSGTSGSAVIKASFLGREVYTNVNVSFSISNNNDNTSTPPPVTPPTPTTVEQLKELKDKIASATGEEKTKLVQEAVTKATEAIKALSNVPLKKEVVDGVLVVSVDNEALQKQFDDIKATIDALKEAAPGTEGSLPSFSLELEVPELPGGAGYVTTGINSSSLAKAKALGITNLEYSSSGFKANFPLTALVPSSTGAQLANRLVNFAAASKYEATPVVASTDETIKFTIKTSTATAELLGSKKAASDVYEISVTAGDKPVDLSGQQVKVSFPLKNVAGLDKELLSVAKVADGKLVFEGGVVVGNTLVENTDKLGTFVVVENKVEFNDISKVKAWAGRQIEVLAAKGAIEGRKAGAFEPNGQVTRAEFAKMLIRALDLDKTAVTGKFTDVKATDWFAPYVAAAVEAGIINGRTETTFVPNATITRAEMAVMVARALEATKGVKASADDLKALEAFKDAGDINASLKDGVAFAANKGLVVGDKGKFNPNATATRAQAAVTIYRAYNFKG
ncbi:S-layer homology domain-containing protein [Paenibacillus sp. OV219]|uniref:S-layer homology domain-containing protein n=1 Tax=Paenibacillus sp. OV219 TaxID=1884377 RepID=UPI0008C0F70A|nr:S-layer homology domain-containing protein [Paenibacillus sp. OV219]SEN60983.1 S-layer homology domain-containing protein [Paenibacillus sp. OV219]